MQGMSMGQARGTASVRKPPEERGPRANRTIARIERATKEIFQRRGYGGTTIDRITQAAGISRASFYTYFSSKRDVLLSLGAGSIRPTVAVIKEFEALPQNPGPHDLRVWVSDFFDMLDRYGSFALAWTQAAHEDPELRRASIAGHLRLCRRMGEAMGAVRGEAFDDPVEQGLVLFSMLERAWSYSHFYDGVIDSARLEADLANVLGAHLGCAVPASRSQDVSRHT
jgi:AcrR family transcriptional regulator